MSLLSGLGTLVISLIAYFSHFSLLYVGITFFISLFYFGLCIIIYFKKYKLVRYYLAIGSPLWIAITHMLIAGYFYQGLAIIASLAIVYVAFQEQAKLMYVLALINIALFFISVAYVNIFGPLFGVIDFQYDELVVFFGSLGWGVILLYQFEKDRTKLVNDLKANNQELKQTTERLEQFTYIASHDLKSPLTTITNFAGLIEKDLENDNSKNIKKNLGFIKTGAEQMNFLVEDILEFSKLSKHNKAEHTLIDLNLVLEKAIYNLKEEIEEKGAKIEQDKLPHFLGSELEFLLLFQNFIQNGIKYNESKIPIVSISSKVDEEHLHLSFKDNGIGIDEEFHDYIFQFFKRLHNSSQYQGTGLGLGLCKKIINDYNGSVRVNSNKNGGSTFTVSLPNK